VCSPQYLIGNVHTSSDAEIPVPEPIGPVPVSELEPWNRRNSKNSSRTGTEENKKSVLELEPKKLIKQFQNWNRFQRNFGTLHHCTRTIPDHRF